jgi:hypothetical protein
VRIARLLLLVGLAVCWPSTAKADFLSWLEELSGPGPFRGDVLWVPVACLDKAPDRVEADEPPRWHRCLVRVTRVAEERSKRKQPIPMLVAVKFGRFRSKDGPRFKDLPASDPDNQGRVSALPVSGLFLFRLRRWVDVGAGAGLLRVSGKGFDPLYRVSLTPISLSVTPLALNCAWQEKRWAYVIRAEFETSYIHGGFKGTDFNNTRTSFKSGPEVLTRVGFAVDAGALAGWIRHGS